MLAGATRDAENLSPKAAPVVKPQAAEPLAPKQQAATSSLAYSAVGMEALRSLFEEQKGCAHGVGQPPCCCRLPCRRATAQSGAWGGPAGSWLSACLPAPPLSLAWRRFLDYFFANLEFGPIEEFCKVRPRAAAVTPPAAAVTPPRLPWRRHRPLHLPLAPRPAAGVPGVRGSDPLHRRRQERLHRAGAPLRPLRAHVVVHASELRVPALSGRLGSYLSPSA